MSRSARWIFLALVLVQAGHSVEEYATRLYDVLPPARFVSGVVSSDRSVGFAVVNVALVGFGLFCFLGPVRHAAPSAAGLAWSWAVLETLNGAAHLTWAAFEHAYRPGAGTAPVLLALGVLLGWQLSHAAENQTG